MLIVICLTLIDFHHTAFAVELKAKSFAVGQSEEKLLLRIGISMVLGAHVETVSDAVATEH
jgi:hypothetical protein